MGTIETVTSGATRDGTHEHVLSRALVACSWVGLLLACAPRSQSEPGVLLVEEKEQTSSFIRNFNPLLEVGDVRWPALHSMYEPLFIYNWLDGAYVPWLGTAYAWSADHRRLRISLRPGVRWSDGAPFTARDVVFTFGLLERFDALDLRGVGEFVDTVTADGDLAVDITFKRVFIPGFYYLVQQPLVPEHVWKDVPDPVSWANPEPVATGPFTEVTSFETQAYQVDRNPYYWQLPDRPQVKAIRFLAFPGNDQAAFALVSGEMDWAGSFVPAIERIFAAKDPEHHHYWFPPIDGSVMLYANTTRAPYDDVRVRKALSLAIDREQVVDIGMYGYTRPADATGLNDAHARYKDATALAAGDWVAHDAARADALLDQAGLRRGSDGLRRLPDGKRWEVAIQVPAGFSDWVRATQVIARGLREVGIDAHMKAPEFNAWYEQVQNGDFSLAIGWSEPYPTPYGYYRAMMSAATVKPIGVSAPENWHRYAAPEADALLAQLETTADPAEQQRLIAELERLFVARAPAIPLFPGPLWGSYNSTRFSGFPDADNPYAPLSPNMSPQALLVLTRLVPR